MMMKPISVRPRKFKAEFEDLGNGKAKMRYEEEFKNEGLVEQAVKHITELEGLKCGRDGNKLWVHIEGDRERVIKALAGEVIMQAVDNERDAIFIINGISGNVLRGAFLVSEAKAVEIAKEPLDLTKYPRDLLETSIGGVLGEAEKNGADMSFSEKTALKGFRQMIEEGIINKNDKFRDALPKIHEYRLKKVMG